MGKRRIVYCLPATLLGMALSTLAQETFHNPPGGGLRLYLDQNKTPIDPDNVRLGQTYFYDFDVCAPSADSDACCVCAPNDEYYGYARILMGKPWTGLTSVLAKTDEFLADCGWCGTLWDQWDWVGGELPTIELRAEWSPGPRHLAVSHHGPVSLTSDYVLSSTLVINCTEPGTIDLGVKQFDVLHEHDICVGQDAQARFKVYNWGDTKADQIVAEIWIADDKQMTQNAVLAAQFNLPTVGAGDYKGQSFTRTFNVPQAAKGLRYFAARVYDQTDPNETGKAKNLSKPDRVSLEADFDWVGHGLEWLEPNDKKVSLFPGQMFKFRYHYQNRGRGPTEPDATIELQIKKGKDWATMHSWPFPPALPCHSAPEVSADFELPFDHRFADDDDIDQNRFLRLVFFNGSAVDPEDETKLHNNKSRRKRVRVVAEPQVQFVGDVGTWLPRGREFGDPVGTEGNAVLVAAEVIPPTPKRRIKFKLQNVSTEPGVCLNYGKSTDTDYHDPDLQLLRVEDLVNHEFDPPNPQEMSIVTVDPVDAATVEVTSFDYGSFGEIVAVAVDSNGNEIGTTSAPLMLPLDSNGNKIGDAHPGDMTDLGGSFDTLPTYDSELLVPGSGTPGDGLTRYEEYRGFLHISNPLTVPETIEHRRTNPDVRNLFVYRETGSELSLGYLPTYVTVVDVTADQINGADWDSIGGVPRQGTQNTAKSPRVVNFNSGFGNKVDQHGLWLFVSNDPAEPTAVNNFYGVGFFNDNTLTSPLTPADNTPPWGMGRIYVHKGWIADMVVSSGAAFNWDVSAEFDKLYESTIAHECLHALSVRHHADFIYPAGWPDPTLVGLPWQDMFVDYCINYDPSVSVSLPMTWEGEAGVLDCMMRNFCIEAWGAISGDTDLDGHPLGSPGEFKDTTWSTVLLSARICDGSEMAGPDVHWPAGEPWTNDNCLSQMIIDDSDQTP